jgi:hypothetical protein
MSTKKLRDAIEALRAVSPRLNSITDLANETVRDVERFLNEECSIGIPASLKIDEDVERGIVTFLEYRRVGPRFRIAVVVIREDGEEELFAKPWADCARDEKLKSFNFLPELLAAIAFLAHKQINPVESTTKAIAAAVAALQQSKASTGTTQEVKAQGVTKADSAPRPKNPAADHDAGTPH